MVYIIAYDYDTNYVFVIKISDIKDETLLEVFYTIFQDLTEKGHKPTPGVTNNQAMRPTKAYFRKEGCR